MREPLLLKGLDGGNPLGFLAALGVLRASTLACPDRKVRLFWSNSQGGWRPSLCLHGDMDLETWLAGLDRFLNASNKEEAFFLADDLTVPIAIFRKAALAAVSKASLTERSYADFLAAFGSDAVQSEINGKKTGEVADTALRTMSGAGHQHFLGFMRILIADVQMEHLRKAIFDSWLYDDPLEKHTMRWDPVDDVRYALRWRNSSGDPERKKGGAVWGANRLAIEALPLLPTAPVNGRLETTGFIRRRGEGTIWSWPLWTIPLGLDTVRSLLALSELREASPDRKRLAAIGVEEVYRSQRITQGKYRNFTPARPA